MLVRAEHKAKAALDIHWRHGNAEQTGLSDASLIWLRPCYFTETPPVVSQSILRESFRLLRVGGEVLF